MQSGDQAEKMLAANNAETPVDQGEKPYTLEEYSLDHFRYTLYILKEFI